MFLTKMVAKKGFEIPTSGIIHFISVNISSQLFDQEILDHILYCTFFQNI